jgi:hypothetical protein
LCRQIIVNTKRYTPKMLNLQAHHCEVFRLILGNAMPIVTNYKMRGSSVGIDPRLLARQPGTWG